MKVGDRLPEISAQLSNGETVSLAHLGKPLVLFFFPKAFSPVCTAEACHFRDLGEEFDAVGAAVYGVSADPNDALDKFKAAHHFPFPLISDPDKTLAKAFGAVGAFGMLKRLTLVADQSGKIVLIVSKLLNANAHADDALEALKSASNR